jgi:hypothetical protein
MEIEVYASAARTATPTAVTIATHRAKAVFVVLDVSAVTADPSLTLTVEGVDSAGETLWTLSGAAVATATTKVLQVGPGVTVAANLTASQFVPDAVKITVTHGDSDSATYAVRAILVR